MLEWCRLPTPVVGGLIAAALVLVGCDVPGLGGRVEFSGGDETLWEDIGAQPDRNVIPVEWRRIWRRGGVDDTLLIRPLRMQGHEDGLYVLDLQAQRILSLDREGRLEWSFGSPGEGPGEFRRARDLRMGAGGDRIYVHDPDNGRITVLDRSGELDRMISIRAAGRSETLVVVGDSAFVLITGAAEDPVAVLDVDGRVVHRGSLPWDGFSDLPHLARQGSAATDGDRWVYGFLLGNGFFPFEGLDSLGYVGRYVEHTDFPPVVVRREGSRTTRRLERPPICSGCSLTLSDGTLYVLFGGEGDDRRRLVDLYRWDDGRYLGSYRLPAPATAIHVHGDRIYLLTDLPFPRITALGRPPVPGA